MRILLPRFYNITLASDPEKEQRKDIKEGLIAIATQYPNLEIQIDNLNHIRVTPWAAIFLTLGLLISWIDAWTATFVLAYLGYKIYYEKEYFYDKKIESPFLGAIAFLSCLAIVIILTLNLSGVLPAVSSILAKISSNSLALKFYLLIAHTLMLSIWGFLLWDNQAPWDQPKAEHGYVPLNLEHSPPHPDSMLPLPPAHTTRHTEDNTVTNNHGHTSVTAVNITNV